MIRAHHYFAGLVLLCFHLLSVSSEAKKATPPSVAMLDSITARGVLLAEYDTAAWHATDAVQALHPAGDALDRYVARKVNDKWIVDFGKINDAGDKFLVNYEATQTDNATTFRPISFVPAREDNGWNLAAARGIVTALKDFQGVQRPYNVAVLPDDTGGMFVYVYLAQVKSSTYPYGADARFRISRDGGSIIDKRQLHKSVIEVPPPPSSQGEPAAGYHVHVLTDLPEDTDVLLVLQRIPRVPEYVGAGGFIFKIDVTGKITVVDKLK